MIRGRPLPMAAFLLFAAGLLAFAAWRALLRSSERLPAPRLSVARQLGDSDQSASGFARALAPRVFAFPADHGAHPAFRSEWWYYTGNLATREGRRFGFQLTFFRAALSPPPPGGATTAARPSAWATRQAWLAHFAVTDVAGRRFQAAERWEREALGLAGAWAEPFHVWVASWSAAADTPVAGMGGETGPRPSATPVVERDTPPSAAPAVETGETPTMRLRAAAEEIAIDVVLRFATRPVPQGDRGLSRKSADPGNASYYYSLPRLAAAGTLSIGGSPFTVSGLAWMDHEWSTSALAPGEVGWDWFSVQLSDGWDLMLYRLRRASGGADPASAGTLIGPRGETYPFPLAAARVLPAGRWRSPHTGSLYPSGWRLALPFAGLDLTLQPLLADQELDLSFRYWEGAISAAGTHRRRPVAGHGYVELTGYASVKREAGAGGN